MEVGSAGAAVSGMVSSCGTASSSDIGAASGSEATMSEVAASGGITVVRIGSTFKGPVTIGGPKAANVCELGIAADNTLPISSPTPLKLEGGCTGDPNGNGNKDAATSGRGGVTVRGGTTLDSVVTDRRGGSSNSWETGSTPGGTLPGPRPALLKIKEGWPRGAASIGASNGVVSTGGWAAVSAGMPCDTTVTGGGREDTNNCETENAVGNRPTTPGTTATVLPDGCIETADGSDDKIPTNCVIVAEGTLSVRIEAGLEVAAPVRGSSKALLIRPAPENEDKVCEGVGLLDCKRSRTFEVDSTGGNSVEGGPNSTVGVGKLLYAETKINVGATGVETCADGAVDRIGEVAPGMIGAN